MASKIVIALGGNALQSGNGPATAEAQLEVVRKTCEHIAQISDMGYELAIVHGNGPQVGRILLASETAREVTPAMPFDVCGAMSQGYIGYHLQQGLKHALNLRNRDIPVVTVATQVIVEENDPAFDDPTKPIGPFYTESEARAIVKEKGYIIYATGLKENSLFLDEVNKSPKMAFVLGNEGSGVSKEVFDSTDETVKIQMHNIDSLNVAMAGSIIMYRFLV